MKTKNALWIISLVIGAIVFLNSCENEDLVELPTLTTLSISEITKNSATGGGEVTEDGGLKVTARGIAYSTSDNPKTSDRTVAAGSGIGSFIAEMSGLNPNADYYVRAYAINSEGTAYGQQVGFTTQDETEGIFTDPRDDQKYKWVKIGNQIWMAENLRATKYNDGTEIPNVIEDEKWRALTTAAYCWYANDIEYKSIYGALYNWFTVDTGILCPEGWHVPSDDDWEILTDYLGESAGGKLKETGTEHWNEPNTGATNEVGFSALPGGWRNPGWGQVGNPTRGGNFDAIGDYGHWYASDEYNDTWVNRRYIVHNSAFIYKWDPYPKTSGFSVRCIRDTE